MLGVGLDDLGYLRFDLEWAMSFWQGVFLVSFALSAWEYWLGSWLGVGRVA